MTHGSLFSGIGGFDLGFHWAGIKTVWSVEIDEYARKVFHKNFPDVKQYSDIHEVGAHNLEQVDIISGGFPCQDISVAGKRAGITGARSGLWFEMFRVCSELRPRYIVIENVANLLRLGLDRVLADLASIGFDAEWACISARDVGARHLRKRIWIVAYPASQGLEGSINQEGQIAGLREDVSDTKSERCGQVQRECTEKLLPKNEDTQKFEGGCGNVSYADQFNDDNGGYGAGKVFGEEQTRLWQSEHWLVEPAICRVADGIPNRVDRLKCLGNAVVPQIPLILAKTILRIEDEKDYLSMSEMRV